MSAVRDMKSAEEQPDGHIKEEENEAVPIEENIKVIFLFIYFLSFGSRKP